MGYLELHAQKVCQNGGTVFFWYKYPKRSKLAN